MLETDSSSAPWPHATGVGQWITAGVADGNLAGLPLVEEAMAQLAVVPDVHIPLPAGIHSGRTRGGDGAAGARAAALTVTQNVQSHPDVNPERLSAGAISQAKWGYKVRGGVGGRPGPVVAAGDASSHTRRGCPGSAGPLRGS